MFYPMFLSEKQVEQICYLNIYELQEKVRKWLNVIISENICLGHLLQKSTL